jgi:hypothetical protein
MEIPQGVEGRVDIYDNRGRRVCTRPLHVEGIDVALAWDGTLSGGGPAPAGVYFLVISAGDTRAERRVVLLR